MPMRSRPLRLVAVAALVLIPLLVSAQGRRGVPSFRRRCPTTASWCSRG